MGNIVLLDELTINKISKADLEELKEVIHIRAAKAVYNFFNPNVQAE